MLHDGSIGERLKVSEYLAQLLGRIVEHGVPRALNESDARRRTARARRLLRKSPLTVQQSHANCGGRGRKRPPGNLRKRSGVFGRNRFRFMDRSSWPKTPDPF